VGNCKVIFISHRGNTIGSNPKLENNPKYILATLNKNYDVEIDVWFVKDTFYLGHDEPQYEVSLLFLQNSKLWCHAKNLQALQNLLKNNIHCFWHQNDDYTLTSKGVIWTYPGKLLTKNSICVMPEKANKIIDTSNCLGVCSDFIEDYK